MARKRVLVHFMHEKECADAAQIISEEVRTNAYLMGEADEAQIAALTNRGLIVQVLEESEPETPGNQSGMRRLAPASTALPEPLPGHYLVSLRGPALQDWKDDLQKHGLQLAERFGGTSYTIRIENPGQLSALRSKPYVRSLRPYTASDTGPISRVRRSATRRGLAPTLSPEPNAFYDVVLHTSQSNQALKSWLQSEKIQVKGESARKFRVQASEDQARQISERDDVARVEAWVPPKFYNDRARTLVGVEEAVAAATTAGMTPLLGSGQVVAVADSGIDQAHPAFNGRLKGVIARGRPGDATDFCGHGSHVAGSIAGTGEDASHGAYRGMAPAATLIFQSVMDSQGELGGLPVDLNDLFQEAYDQGARIHNNSWGADVRGAYPSSSIEVDEFVWKHPDMLVVIAAGNAGTCEEPEMGERKSKPGFVDWYSVGAPGTSKNALVVGASRSDRTQGGFAEQTYQQIWPTKFSDPPTGQDRVSGDAEAMAAFSSRGPSNDSRIKPDVVAPGTDIASVRSSLAPSSNFGGLVKGTDGRYGYMCGTSMATPIVTGLAALVREYLVTQRNHPPSAALLRAMIVNGARPLTGASALAEFEPQGGVPSLPNYHQGFGRVDLLRTVPIRQDFLLAFIDGPPGAGFMMPGLRRRFRFQTDKEAPLRVTLTYTDIPGRGVQNDLNLFLQQPDGSKHIGNESLKRVGMLPDPNNNVEVIRIEMAAKGEYIIQITATNILRGPQGFALVVAGALSSNTLQEI